MKKQNKNKLNIKNALYTLGGLTAVVAPVATLVACGGGSSKSEDIDLKSILNGVNESSQKSAIQTNLLDTYKSFELRQNEVELSILNTNKFGILPVTRLMANSEAKRVDNWVYAGIANGNNQSKADYMNGDLKEYANKVIDDSVQVNGKSQSVDNPLASFDLTKKNILDSGKDSFEGIAEKINKLITENPTKKYAILTVSKTKDTAVNGEFTNGEYTVNVYEKKQNSDSLNKVTEMLKDTTKFGVSDNALNKLGGFSLFYQGVYFQEGPNANGSWNYSMIDDAVSKDGSKDTERDYVINKDATTGMQTLTYAANPLAATHFTSTQEANSAATVNFSKVPTYQFTPEEKELIAKTISTGKLVNNQKTKEMNLELTVAKYEGEWNTGSGSKYVTPGHHITNDFSIETIYIPMPKLTSFAKDYSYSNDKLQEALVNTHSFSKLFNSLNSLLTNSLSASNLTNMDLVNPYTRSLLLDLFQKMALIGKYHDELSNKVFFDKLLEFVKANYQNFDLPTFLKTLDQQPSLPSSPTQLNSSHVYTLLQNLDTFYAIVDEFGNQFKDTPEGTQFKNDIESQVDVNSLYKVIEEETRWHDFIAANSAIIANFTGDKNDHDAVKEFVSREKLGSLYSLVQVAKDHLTDSVWSLKLTTTNTIDASAFNSKLKPLLIDEVRKLNPNARLANEADSGIKNGTFAWMNPPIELISIENNIVRVKLYVSIDRPAGDTTSNEQLIYDYGFMKATASVDANKILNAIELEFTKA